jgi:ribosome maturation factor RimP
VENRKRYRGIILGVENDLILIKVDGEKYQFDFSDVLKAKLVMTDELVERSAVNPS